jgi:hypothetical protein
MIQITKIVSSIFTYLVRFINGVIRPVFNFLLCFFLLCSAQSQTSSLFDSDEVIELNLRSDFKTVFKDRKDDPQYHSASLQYKAELNTIKIPIKIKTRGHFRKISSNCKYPPLLLNFSKIAIPESSIFEGQDKMKLVTPCRDEKYVIHEYLVYKLYNLITPRSFKARLVKVIFQDTVKNKSSGPYYGILMEEEEQMARRNQATSFENIGQRPEYIYREDFLQMAIFEFMIGNTDWSVQYQQNIKLIKSDSSGFTYAIPYDFDHAGIVKAPYAKPAPELKLRSTSQRRYRGYCIPEMNLFTAAIETFNRLKEDFYALYDGNPLLDNKYKKQTLKFLDKFYETINDPEKAKKAFSYPCDRSGTGNIVIKGLKKNE